MGKLIKNHWARLIVLTAAACKPGENRKKEQQTQPSTSRLILILILIPRPIRRRPLRHLLAQTLLRLPHQNPRPDRQTHPRPPNPQPRRRRHHPRLRMAAPLPRRHDAPPQHRGPCAVFAAREPAGRLAVPGDERGGLSFDWVWGVFLGVYGRGGWYLSVERDRVGGWLTRLHCFRRSFALFLGRYLNGWIGGRGLRRCD